MVTCTVVQVDLEWIIHGGMLVYEEQVQEKNVVRDEIEDVT